LVWRNPNGNLNVAYLNWNGNEWNLNFNWLENDFNDNYRLVRLRNWFHSPSEAGFSFRGAYLGLGFSASRRAFCRFHKGFLKA